MSQDIIATRNNVQHLVRTIREHITRGDKAAEKSEQHYVSAGRHLAALKREHGGTWAEWETLLKEKVGISTGRASELMQLGDGRKTLAQIRDRSAESQRQTRKEISSRRREENNIRVVEENGRERPATSDEVAKLGDAISRDGQARKRRGWSAERWRRHKERKRGRRVGRDSALKVTDENGKLRAATKEESAAFMDASRRAIEQSGVACGTAELLSNPIAAAWRGASAHERDVFVRHWAADLRQIMKEIEDADAAPRPAEGNGDSRGARRDRPDHGRHRR
jgi:hypothetical protein